MDAPSLSSLPPDVSLVGLMDAPSLSSLPPDVFEAILVDWSLSVHDLVAVRSSSKALRRLTSSNELWASCAARRWDTLNSRMRVRIGFGLGVRICRSQMTVSSSRSLGPVLPIMLGASLVDVCRRLVRFPTALYGAHGVTTITHREAKMGDLEIVDFNTPCPSVVALERATVSTVRCAGADVAWPSMPHHGVPVRPLPFATEATSLGRAGAWALRMTAFFEATLLNEMPRGEASEGEPTPTPPTLCIGLAPPDFELSGTLPGHAPGTIGLHLVAGERVASVLMGGSVAAVAAAAAAAAAADAGGNAAGNAAAAASKLVHRVDIGTPPALRDTFGCGIDYASGRAFWTRGNVVLCETALPTRSDGGGAWLPTVGATPCSSEMGDGDETEEGAAATVAAVVAAADAALNGAAVGAAGDGVGGAGAARHPCPPRLDVNLGTAPFEHDVLRREEGAWHAFRSDRGLKRLFEQCCVEGSLHPDESQRGWPWRQRSTWEAAAEAHVAPWIAHLDTDAPLHLPEPAPPATTTTTTSAAAAAAESGATNTAATAADAADAADAATTADTAALVSNLPAALPLWPRPDPLGMTEAERAELAAFALRWRLPHSGLLATAGLNLALMSELPLAQVLSHARQAGLPMGGICRLRRAICCELGYDVDLDRGVDASEAAGGPTTAVATAPTATAAAAAAAAATAAAGSSNGQRRPRLLRAIGFASPQQMVVLLSPRLPVRLSPELGAAVVGWRRVGAVVSAIAQTATGDWLRLEAELQPDTEAGDDGGGGGRAGATRERTRGSGGWVLLNGGRARQPGPLLRGLSVEDEVRDGVCTRPHHPPAAAAGERAAAGTAAEARREQQEDEDGEKAGSGEAGAWAWAGAATADGARFEHQEGPAVATLLPEGQAVRERELLMLVQLAQLPPGPGPGAGAGADDAPAASWLVPRLLELGASTTLMAERGSSWTMRLARRAGCSVGAATRLVNALQRHLLRAPNTAASTTDADGSRRLCRVLPAGSDVYL